MLQKRIAILGGGNMAKSLAQALLSQKITTSKNLTITGRSLPKLKSKFGDLKVKLDTDNQKVIKPKK